MYLAGVAYERVVNRISFLNNFRINLVGVLEKGESSKK
jgi:hypothetical protein